MFFVGLSLVCNWVTARWKPDEDDDNPYESIQIWDLVSMWMLIVGWLSVTVYFTYLVKGAMDIEHTKLMTIVPAHKEELEQRKDWRKTQRDSMLKVMCRWRDALCTFVCTPNQRICIHRHYRTWIISKKNGKKWGSTRISTITPTPLKGMSKP